MVRGGTMRSTRSSTCGTKVGSRQGGFTVAKLQDVQSNIFTFILKDKLSLLANTQLNNSEKNMQRNG